MHYAKQTYYSRIRRDSVCNTFQDPIITSVIDAKKITAWGESGFPARFLAGEHACEWAAWFKAHHPDRVMPLSNSDEDNCLERAALLDQQKGDWAQREYAVSAGSDNAFLLRGRTATLASTPDLIVARDNHVLIIGVHTGQQHRSHGTLIRIHMYALRKALGRYHGM